MYEVFFLCGGARGGTPLIFDMACGYDNNTHPGILLKEKAGPAGSEYRVLSGRGAKKPSTVSAAIKPAT